MSSFGSESDEEMKIVPIGEKTPKGKSQIFFDQKSIESQEDEYYMSEPSSTPRSRSKDLSQSDISILASMDSRFTQAFEELMVNFKVPHYGCEHTKETFQVINPSLVNKKYVVYNVRGEDNLGFFEGQRRYNEFYQIR